MITQCGSSVGPLTIYITIEESAVITVRLTTSQLAQIRAAMVSTDVAEMGIIQAHIGKMVTDVVTAQSR